MRILKHFLFAALLLVLASDMSLAQRGHRYPPVRRDSSFSMRWHPRIGSHFGLSDSCWAIFISQLPADAARELTSSFADIKATRAKIDSLHNNYRAAIRAGDTARARMIWNEIRDLFGNIRDDWQTIKPILRKYHDLLVETRRDCDHNGRSTAVGIRVSPVVPNPATTNAHFSYTTSAAGHVLIEISDQAGNRTKTVFDGDAEAGSHDLRLDLGGMQSGVYLLRVQAGADVNTEKFVIRN